MKKSHILLIGALLAILSTSKAQSQWQDITPSNVQSVMDISVIDNESAVLLAGDSVSRLYKTNDGGTNWQVTNVPVWLSPDPMYWAGIEFIDVNTGFIHGLWLVNGGVFAGGTESFVLYKTTDGGENWTLIYQDIPSVGFESPSYIHFFNANQGVCSLVTGLGYYLIKTTDDGGVSWQVQDTLTHYNYSEYFKPDGSGSAIQYERDHSHHTNQYFLYKIEDFGKTWTEIGVPGIGAEWLEHRNGLWFEEVLFLHDTLAYRTRIDPQAFGSDDDIYYLDRSTDGGVNWLENYFSVVDYINILVLDKENQWITTWETVFRRSSTSSTDSEAGAQNTPLVRIYPNPASNFAHIESKEVALLSLHLSDPQGRMLEDVQFLQTDQIREYDLSLARYPTGLYFLSLRTEKGSVTRKVVKD